MTIEENLKQIEAALRDHHRPLVRYCGKCRQALESLAALREQIAEVERGPSRIKLAALEKERDEAEDRESMALEALATARLWANTSTKELDKHRQEVADQREQLSAAGRMIDELTAERDAAWKTHHNYADRVDRALGALTDQEAGLSIPEMIAGRTERIAALEAAAKERDARVLWRVGSKVPVNLYRGDQIMGQCQTPEIAAEIVVRMNAGRGVRDSLAEPKPPAPAASGTR